MSCGKAFLTLDEALAAVMESDDEEEVDTIVIIPPDTGEVTDEEVEIDSNQPALPLDVSGMLEVKAGSKARKQQEKHVATKRPSNKGRSNKSNEKAAAEKGADNYPKDKARNEPKERNNWPKRKWGLSDTLFTEMEEAL